MNTRSETMPPPLAAGTPSERPAVPWMALALILATSVALHFAVDTRQALLFLVGGLLGLALYHAAFGFTSAWRVFITERRGAGLRAQMVMLALAVILFFPALSSGTLFDTPVRGNVAPLGTSVAIGAFLFGIGMQLGGGCASGTLFTAGGGNARMLVTLAFFIIGATVATLHLDWWFALPSLPATSIVEALGLWPALAANLLAFALIAALTMVLERRRHGRLEQHDLPSRRGWSRVLHGPWPLLWGAVLLALLNYATLVLAGRPWGITGAFSLWGAKTLQSVGMDVAQWPFWQRPSNAQALAAPVWHDITSVMNFGIMLGAFLAAGLAGRFAPSLRIPLRSLVAAVLGGLMLGYGARLAYGCNIGAYFSGIASGSLHGWLWLLAAFLGNAAGVRLRPIFFPNEKVQAQLTGC